MSHPGKFVSINLNRSYGQPVHSSHGGRPSRPAASSGAGGGMVVLSRHRGSSLAKPQPPKLSVPPPLNLPSLRKEHERFDGVASSASGAASAPARSGAPTAGWTKPAPAAEKPPSSAALPGSTIKPPSYGFPEKAVVLSGEDFPSLKAAVTPPPPHRQKEADGGRVTTPEARSMPLGMRPQVTPPHAAEPMASGGGIGAGTRPSDEKAQKHDLGLLPMIRLRYDSDWADDERDTGLILPERDSRERGFGRSEVMIPGRNLYGATRDPFKKEPFGRDGVATNKENRQDDLWRSPVSSQHDREQTEDQPYSCNLYGATRDPFKKEPFGRDGVATNKENRQDDLWRSPVSSQHDREQTEDQPYSAGRGSTGQLYQEIITARGSKDLSSNSRERHIVYGQNRAEQHGIARVGESANEWYAYNSNNWPKVKPFQNNIGSKVQPFSVNKGPLINEPVLKINREKQISRSPDKSLIEDGGFKSMSTINLSAIKKKKEAIKPTDFHDSARELYEAELDRILRVQEQERQRVMEERERAREFAQKQEVERERLIREAEARHRSVEDQTRQAAWQAEQEKLESAKIAEEQRIAREEEKKRIAMEEERRREAARQKLLELEAKIAKRQAESNVDRIRDGNLSSAANDEVAPGTMKVSEVSHCSSFGNTKNISIIGEHMNTTSPLESSGPNTYSDTVPRVHALRDGHSSFIDKERAYYGPWATFPEQGNIHHNPQQDSFAMRFNSPRKEFNDRYGSLSPRPSLRDRKFDSPWSLEDYGHVKVPRWDAPREIDRFDRQSDFDNEIFTGDRYEDASWPPSSSRGSPLTQQGDRILQSSEANDFSAFTRPRYSMRQPRVPPPPTVTSFHRSTIGASVQRPNSSFVDGGMGESSCRDDNATMRGQYGSVYQEASHQHEIPADHIAVSEHQIGDRESPVLGSQSSLSVSSPPSSPPHVSHDEIDVSGDSPALPTSADGERTVLSDNVHASLALDVDTTSKIAPSGSVSHLEDDEWSSENDDRRKQDEYEDGDSYQEDEINEADDDNLDLDDNFLEEQQSSVALEPVILGFDEGVQVEIPSNSELELSSMKNTERAIGGRLSPGAGKGNVSGTIAHSCPIMEAEKSLQDLTLTDNINEEPSGGLLEPVSSSQLPQPSSISPIMSSASVVVGQNEVPVNLQFGLFTGPPLIPTPVPAIQIGSIQMPIHLHNHNNPSLAQTHSSTTPLYQFGQLRYVRSIAQSTQQLPSRSTIPAHSSGRAQCTYQLNQNFSYGLPEPVSRNTHHNTPRQAVLSTVIDKSSTPIDIANLPLAKNNSDSQYLNAPPHNQVVGAEGFHGQVDKHSSGGISSSVPHAEMQRNHDLSLKRCYEPASNNIESSQSVSEGEALSALKSPGAVSGGRGRKCGYTVIDINMRSSVSVVQPSHKDIRGFQRRARRNVRRTEFRVPENAEKNKIQAESFTHSEQNDIPYSHGTTRAVSGRNTNRREGDVNKSSRTNEVSDQTLCSSYRTPQRTPERSQGGNKKSKTDAITEGDATSLLAGMVRVTKQQGIEVPVDADGFIEVRSKKQIMSVRRELREKENKSKMRIAKTARKQQQVSLQNSGVPSVNKRVAPLNGETTKKVPLDPAIPFEARVADSVKPSVSLKGDMASMNPIGPPSFNAETHTNYYAKQPKHGQVSSDMVTSTKLSTGLSEDNNKGIFINTQFNLVSWDNSLINHQVMPLTQTQLEEAMRPAKFEQQTGSDFSLDSNSASSPTVTTEQTFLSSASPINSLLAGEKIQFGAVISPTVLAPINQTVSTGLGAAGSSRSDKSGNDVFFEKEKATSKEPCPNAEDAEAEAEAAASAVAVAVISTDEGSPADATTASSSEHKSFSSKDQNALATTRGAITGHAGRPSTKEPLTVTLPADLSVDTPPMSLWPPLTSSQASGPMLSQFPGAQPSHFSCFEMNHMLGGHIFAFGPSDESAGVHGQHPQRSNVLPSAPLGAWPQCQSGFDSFYQPPTGFAGPFISHSLGGIPGVQGPPHMVVYNQFAPVGQFGQMGLGFLGTTYIPGDKQPDWKQNQGPSVVAVSQSDPNNQNMVSGQVNSSNVPTPVQHLRPTAIMPIPSPLTIFDIAPFQSSTDIQMQPCWPRMPIPPLHSVPLSVSLQQHPVEGTAARQFIRNVPVDNASTKNHFQGPSASAAPSDGNKTSPSSAASQLTNELGLVEPVASSSSCTQIVHPSFVKTGVISNEVSTSAKVVVKTIPSNVNPGSGAGTSNPKGGQITNMSCNTKTHQSSSDQQYQHPVNSQDRRARVTQKNGTGNEWQRRQAYLGRNQNSGPDKNSGTGRMKQIYVAKSSATRGRAPSD